MRDLERDLRCLKEYAENDEFEWDFLEEAVAGWPEAVERAIKAEKSIQRYKCMHKSLVISMRLWLEKGDEVDIEGILNYHEQLAEKGEEWCIEPAVLETAIRG